MRYVQFVFDDRMVEFPVSWSSGELGSAVTRVMEDDGYLWVPLDQDEDTGTFVNLSRCTVVRLVEKPQDGV